MVGRGLLKTAFSSSDSASELKQNLHRTGFYFSPNLHRQGPATHNSIQYSEYATQICMQATYGIGRTMEVLCHSRAHEVHQTVPKQLLMQIRQ